jgi:hypothetical protein
MYPFFLSDLNENLFSRQIFEKYSNIKFQENPSGGSRVVSCGRMDERTDGQTDRQADMTKLIVSFLKFEKAPKNTQMKCVEKRAEFFSVKHDEEHTCC